MNNFTVDKLIIGKKEYSVKIGELNVSDLKFYTENPRVFSTLNYNGIPSQDEIEKYMTEQDHVKQLKVSIETNGGLIDPIVVRDGDFVVLEGNSRLAAYRILCENNPLKWGKIKVKLLPGNIDDAAVFALLGQYHIIGRKDWEPYEQASYLYRRHKQTKLPIDYMAEELGITKGKAKKMIEIIDFMIENDDLNKRNWSYYEEYLKNAGLKKYRETNPDLDTTVVTMIKADEFKQAADIRKMGNIAKLSDKQSKKIMQKIASRDVDFYDAYEKIKESGKLDDVIKKLSKFRELINDDSFEKQLNISKDVSKANFEIKKIIDRLQNIKKRLKKYE